MKKKYQQRLSPSNWKQPHWRVLCYHGIEKDQTESFRQQITTLQDMGLKPVTFEQGFQSICSNNPSRPTFSVTFDDGASSVLINALPILESLDVPAFYYISADYIQQGRCYRDVSSPRALSWADLRGWLERGHGVGSHTLTHANLRHTPPEVCLQELRDSKTLLEDRLEQSVIHFAYPWGQHSRATYQLIRSCGLYISGATIDRGQMYQDHDPFLLRRDVCSPSTSIEDMLKRMRWADNPAYRFLTRVRRMFLHSGK